MDVKEHVERTVARKVAIGVALLVGFIVFIIAGGLVVRLLWNWLMPDIVGLRQISWAEAVGLLALSRILFGGFGGNGGRRHDGRWRHERREWWKTPRERDANDIAQ